MQINFLIETDDEQTDETWIASVTVTTDNGRVAEVDAQGTGGTVREAVESLLADIHDGDDHDWLKRSWGINVGSEPEGDSFIIVDGGLVQNEPSLPVFDLDALSSDVDASDEIADLYERMSAHPDQKRIAPWLRDVERHVKGL